ncbi:hypothetical protein Msi02_85380 [Microbispora siamensis]|uniref:Uncharacterized protein n=1 Tax=Microbispora siamensis TaxID=564413 RepID=A0ABQ4H1Z2_9ACTN|nr:hypothetical protein Msi02_85380 [Microbispora siamensis]
MWIEDKVAAPRTWPLVESPCRNPHSTRRATRNLRRKGAPSAGSPLLSLPEWWLLYFKSGDQAAAEFVKMRDEIEQRD